MENKNKTYDPTPIDVSSIVVPSDLNLLIEKLAKNVHDNWAATKLKDGWSYGPVRDDVKKQTPCLVEYEDLPESEKKYDREIAVSILKVVLKLGYDILPANSADKDKSTEIK